LAVAGLRYDGEVSLGFECASDSLTKQGLFVGNQDIDHVVLGFFQWCS
jgi:hypothetical protein